MLFGFVSQPLIGDDNVMTFYLTSLAQDLDNLPASALFETFGLLQSYKSKPSISLEVLFILLLHFSFNC